jgi:hypothetical protein
MVLGVMVAVAAGFCAVMAAEPPSAPKVSTFAPAKDVAAQIKFYVSRLEDSEALQNEAAFKQGLEDAKDTATGKTPDLPAQIAKDSSTLILLALAAGLHDEDNEYKAAAPALLKAAQELANAKGFAATKAAVEAVKKALEASGGAPAELKWVKSASLPDLMKQVPLVNARLKRNLRGEKLKSKAKDNAGDSATLAVIAQGSLADTSETKSADQVAKWHGFCVQMRDAAAALNKAVHEGDAKGAEKAMSALNQSCDDCHEVFHKVEKKEE